MKKEIDQIIKQINCGIVPAGYKRSKIGIVPNDWPEVKLSHFLSVSKEKNIDLLYSKDDVFSISGELGIVNQIELLGRSYAGESVVPYGVVKPNDIVYTKSPLKANPYGIIKTNKTGKTGIVSTLYAIFNCKDNVDPAFVQYYFESDKKLNDYLHPIVNIGAKHDMKISDENSLNGIVVFPPLPEQQKIAEILSTQDKIIELKEKLLEQKQTQKKWLMQKLLSNDGAIFTLGGVRIDKSGWKNTKLKDVGTFSKGAGIKREDANSGTIPAVRYGEIYTVHNEYIKNFYSFISEEIASQSKLLKKGDLLFSCSGETKEDIGKCVAFISDCRAYAGGDIILLSPKQSFDSKFLGFLLNSDIVNKQRCGYAQGDSIVHISSESLGKMSILLPPLPEQQAIAEVLSTTDKEIDLLKSDIEQEKLKKKSLMQLLLTGIVRVKV